MASSRRSSLVWMGAALGLAILLVVSLVYRGRAPRPQAPAKPAAALPARVQTPAVPPLAGPRLPGANVVVITVDTLRRDHLAPYGAAFPTVAASRLAREGVVFEHAVAHVPLTLPSHTSIFTGLYPPHHAVRDNGGFVVGKDVTTLAERFLARGYTTAGFVSSYVSIPGGALAGAMRPTTIRSSMKASRAVR
jgi:hypothetical protein